MPVNYRTPPAGSLFPVAGVELGPAKAGIKKPDRYDLLVVRLAYGACVAGVFTQNRFCAAPVSVCRDHLDRAANGSRPIRALVVNTGNANAGTGLAGIADARAVCAQLAALIDCAPEAILPFSTGVIMEPLPVSKIAEGLPRAVAALAPDAWSLAAQAIMTTDTVPKAASRRVTVGGSSYAITGISKGAGMIQPNMATMLGFVATDAPIAPALLDEVVREIA
jgi:glutamate N-acetyltransferase/amino-acid N-acetyltransferase